MRHSPPIRSALTYLTILMAHSFAGPPLDLGIEFIFAFKQKGYMQVDNTMPAGPPFWFFNAGVQGGGLVTGGTATYPGSGGPITLTGSEGDYSLDLDEVPSQGSLDALVPNGLVSMTVDVDGVTENFGAFEILGDGYPITPYFLNAVEFAAADRSQDFTLTWNEFTGSEADDQVLIEIFENNTEVSIFEILPNTATSYFIEAETLIPEGDYDAAVLFVNSTDGTEPEQSIIGYITSAAFFTGGMGGGGGGNAIQFPDSAVGDAVKLELGIGTNEDITEDIIVELSSLTVASDQPIDLTGLEHAENISELTLNSESVSKFGALSDLEFLEEVKLFAPQKDGLFFTHWSDGSQENPRILNEIGETDFNLVAQYSNEPLSPYAGGYTLIINGIVTERIGLPPGIDVQVNDPYELRLNYLILEEFFTGDLNSIIVLDYFNAGLLPSIVMDVEIRIGGYRWILSSTGAGIEQAAISTSIFEAFDIFQFQLTDLDTATETDYPGSLGTEVIFFNVQADGNQGELFNGPLKIPDQPGYVNWDAITDGTIHVRSQTPDLSTGWIITLSHAPGPNQSYRLIQHPSYLDLAGSIVGFSTDTPTAGSGTASDSVDLDWNDPHAGSFETTYEVWRASTNSLGSATKIADGLLNNTFSDFGSAPGQQFYYWIRAIRDGLKADFSAPVIGFRGVAAPEDVQASQGDFSDRIRIIWAKVSGASTYSVYRSSTNNVNDAQLIQDGIAGNEFDDFSIDTDDTFFYWVTSESGGITSDFSDPASGYRVADGITTVRASDGLFSERVRVAWDEFPAATAYTIYRNGINNFSSATILAMDVADTFYDDLLGVPDQGIIYFYWVIPQIGGENGNISNADPGYIPAPTATNLAAWGDNDFNQTNLPLFLFQNIVDFAAGANHSLALSSTGTVIGWGRNEFGQATPPGGLSTVIDLAVGYDHSLALKEDGTVVAWGRNTFGKATVPEDLMNVIDIQAGAEHSLALLADGSVVGWGANDLEQISIPEGLNQVVQIAAGGFHNLARLADGTVIAWGDNSLGQLDIPSRITQVVDIAAGWNHNLVILPDGTVDGWGDNRRGQLDFPADTQEPPQAKGFVIRDPVTASIVDISGGLFHSLALSANGELAAWGENKNSQTTTPENVGAISQIDAGNEHNLVIGDRTGPTIESLIPNSSNLLSGEDLVLRVRATGDAELSHQWFLDDVAIEGATSDALFLSNVSPSETGAYTVKVSSDGVEVSSEAIQIVVNESQATITSQTIRAIKGFDGTYLFSDVETNPPSLNLAVRYQDQLELPASSGTYSVSLDVDQQGFTATPVENVTMILDTLNDGPVRFITTGTTTAVRYRTVEGFASSLQTSSDMRDWILLERVPNGDGQFRDFNLTSPTDNFYRVVFEVPQSL